MKEGSEEDAYSVFFWWAIGISLLTVALFISARMGIYQEVLYKQYGKHPWEALYVTVSVYIRLFVLHCAISILMIGIFHKIRVFQHLLPLPGFLLIFNNIKDHIIIANASEPVVIPFIEYTVPILWVYLLLNSLTQYVCISSVFVLTTECTSLTVTLVVTLRKFISLLFSIVYFNNPFTVYHWVGTSLVFLGTMIFTETPPFNFTAKPKQKIK